MIMLKQFQKEVVLMVTIAINVVVNLNDNSPVKWMSRPTFVKSMLVSDGQLTVQ